MARVDGRLRYMLLAVILLLAAGFRFWGITWGLHDANVSRRPHPDEWVVYWVFHWFDQYRNLNPCPRAGSACFFDWGGLYLYLAYFVRAFTTPILGLLPAGAFGHHADPEFIRATVAGRVTSATLSCLTVLPVYRLGSLLRGPACGLIAALTVALAGLLIQLAHFATPDSATIFLMSASLLAMATEIRTPSARGFAISGALCGFAAGSEYHMALLALPLVVAWLLAPIRRGAWLALGIGAMAVAWLIANPYAMVELPAFLEAGAHSLRLRTVDSSAVYPDRWDAYGPAWLYVVRYPMGYGLGFTVTLWLIAGAFWAAVKREKIALLILSWVVLYFVLVTLSPAKYMRYSAPLFPPLAVLSARFLVDLASVRLARQRLVPLAAALVTVLQTGTYDAAYAQLFSRPDSRQLAATWIDDHVMRGSRVSFEEIPTGLLNLPYFVTPAGYQPCFSNFSPSRLDGPARVLVVDDYALEEHPYRPAADVLAFRAALQDDSAYHPVFHVGYTPTFLGLSFPIDQSPHDWRYPDHQITVYRHHVPAQTTPGQCFPNLRRALAALYVPPPRLAHQP